MKKSKRVKVIVDTSIWIKYFNNPSSKEAEALTCLIQEEEVLMVGAILAEILQGAKNKVDFEMLRASFEDLPFLEESKRTWEGAGEISFSLRRKGLLLPLTDCLIASLAMENNASVFTLDKHFENIKEVKLWGKTP